MTNIGAASDVNYYIDRWRLRQEDDAIVTRTSHLLPVRMQGVAAVLKIAVEAEEELGNELIAWWDGHGVPLVLAREGNAVLLERAPEGGSLADPVRHGRDETRRPASSARWLESSTHPSASQPRASFRFRNGSANSRLLLIPTVAFSLFRLRPLTNYWPLPAKPASCTETSTTTTFSTSASEDGSRLIRRV